LEYVYTFIVLLHFTLPSTLIRKKERKKGKKREREKNAVQF